MASCILYARTTGSLNASIQHLLQSDVIEVYIHPSYYLVPEILELELTSSLEASMNHFFETVITGSLEASTKIKLNAKYCQQIQVAL